VKKNNRSKPLILHQCWSFFILSLYCLGGLEFGRPKQ
jgi:hypothetical protein